MKAAKITYAGFAAGAHFCIFAFAVLLFLKLIDKHTHLDWWGVTSPLYGRVILGALLVSGVGIVRSIPRLGHALAGKRFS
jgi:hypothetical protein